ncbi:hypothetical protein HOU09_gp057 [Dickeya phage vB_DsoM_AD1]|uniref:Uncharacterized protein n=1 Tax=Dickeya phage vB_DsoM_AD1 TaxID=2283029 RepID=A0A384ZXY3_9CAUD|nr:hypothetical protein HOU09_gp057 [Dickeya phage vB_DsoM_AD1]AXG67101.1 hypothetical protein AD1_057 [Dickeya phage vB_DsoM_AD1]
MMWHEGVFLASAVAFALSWGMMRIDAWCEQNITNHNRSYVIWWAFIVCAIIFFLVVLYNACLEWSR